MNFVRERLQANEKSLMIKKSYNNKPSYYFKQRRSVDDRGDLQDKNAIISLNNKFSKNSAHDLQTNTINLVKSQEILGKGVKKIFLNRNGKERSGFGSPNMKDDINDYINSITAFNSPKRCSLGRDFREKGSDQVLNTIGGFCSPTGKGASQQKNIVNLKRK